MDTFVNTDSESGLPPPSFTNPVALAPFYIVVKKKKKRKKRKTFGPKLKTSRDMADKCG